MPPPMNGPDEMNGSVVTGTAIVRCAEVLECAADDPLNLTRARILAEVVDAPVLVAMKRTRERIVADVPDCPAEEPVR